MDRRHELENLRRSIVMLSPSAQAPLSRDAALELLTELQDVHAQLDSLRAELRRLAETN